MRSRGHLAETGLRAGELEPLKSPSPIIIGVRVISLYERDLYMGDPALFQKPVYFLQRPVGLSDMFQSPGAVNTVKRLAGKRNRVDVAYQAGIFTHMGVNGIGIRCDLSSAGPDVADLCVFR